MVGVEGGFCASCVARAETYGIRFFARYARRAWNAFSRAAPTRILLAPSSFLYLLSPSLFSTHIPKSGISIGYVYFCLTALGSKFGNKPITCRGSTSRSEKSSMARSYCPCVNRWYAYRCLICFNFSACKKNKKTK